VDGTGWQSLPLRFFTSSDSLIYLARKSCSPRQLLHSYFAHLTAAFKFLTWGMGKEGGPKVLTGPQRPFNGEHLLLTWWLSHVCAEGGYPWWMLVSSASRLCHSPLSVTPGPRYQRRPSPNRPNHCLLPSTCTWFLQIWNPSLRLFIKGSSSYPSSWSSAT
jgi:hypothetical protein